MFAAIKQQALNATQSVVDAVENHNEKKLHDEKLRKYEALGVGAAVGAATVGLCWIISTLGDVA